jgi:transcription elongation factor GreA
MQIPRRKADELRKRDEGPLYLTEDGLRTLQEKLARLKKAAPDLAAEAARTAAYGDRSDNAEYKDAKGRLRHTNWNILEIQDQLKRVVVIQPGRNALGTIQLGSKVTVEIHGKEKRFEIVGPHETDPGRGRISDRSPLGSALMGHAKNDVVRITTTTGLQEYQIKEVQ